MKNSTIEWTEQTWNPTIGCSKVSEGCKNCYAEVMARRLKAMGVKAYSDGFTFKYIQSRVKQPLLNKKPTIYFVNSMSDLFHENMKFKYLDEIFNTIKSTPHHTYQILTKRPNIMKEYFKDKYVPHNAWLGCSVESKKVLYRIDILKQIKANTRFLSCEPLLQDLGELNLKGIHWVIVGGESGNRARPMSKEWAINIKEQCSKQNVAFFFKQWGAYGSDGVKRSKKVNGRELNNRVYDEYPKI